MSFGESSRTEVPLSRCTYMESCVLRYGGVNKVDGYGKSKAFWGRSKILCILGILLTMKRRSIASQDASGLTWENVHMTVPANKSDRQTMKN